jgi:mono/diheme cytochrome c family protein
MRRAVRSLSVLALAADSLGACARVQMPRPTALDATRGSQRFPGLTVGELEHGRSLYVARCSSCHQPVPPSRIAAQEWPEHVAEMSERAHLDAQERRLVEAYLVTMAEAGAAATAAK